ncbi:hypothetical protein DC522_17560 [Microvirga sp. KLBC 81]|nr:hypothetical protein DC522_17560 [Microvirga sp. KLBC 81]
MFGLNALGSPYGVAETQRPGEPGRKIVTFPCPITPVSSRVPEDRDDIFSVRAIHVLGAVTSKDVDPRIKVRGRWR